MQSLITIIIPTYNRAKYLYRALQSLVDQKVDSSSFEVIIIDDGGRDNTKKIVEEFQKKINLKYIYQEHGGVSNARNKGIEESSGEVIVFFDDDATAQNDWIQNIKKIMSREYIITGRIEPIKNNIWQYFAPHYNQGNKPVESSVLLEGNCAIKKEVFDNVDNFDENLTYGHEGGEFIARAKEKYKIMYYPNIVIKHDYAFGIINYLNKQFRFGYKMVYLNIDKIKSIFYLVFNYRTLRKGKTSSEQAKRKIGLFKKIQIYPIVKLGSLAYFFGSMIGYLKYKK